MDLSETYIKMCEKAEEIQGKRAYKALFAGSSYINIDQLGNYWAQKDVNSTSWHVAWLPRQDQLQEMVRGTKHCHLLAAEFAAYFHGTIDPFMRYIGRDNCTVNSDESFEQMWLAFVMKKLYKKVWDGDDWIGGDGE